MSTSSLELGWKCKVCVDTASALHEYYGLLSDAISPVRQIGRPGQTDVDLGIRLGCVALPEDERTECYSIRYAVGMTDNYAFSANAYAKARDQLLLRRVPSRKLLEEDERKRFAIVLERAGEEHLTTKEEQFLEAETVKEALADAIEKEAQAFRACEHMAMCGADDQAGGCDRALNSELCRVDGACEPARKACSKRCRICAWVVRSWPAWKGDCAKISSVKRKKEVKFSKKADREPKVDPETPAAGPLSPPFEEMSRKDPPTEIELRRHCLAVSWAAQDIADAERVVSGRGGEMGAQMFGTEPWSPLLACACMSQCPYTLMDSFKLRDAGCIGPSSLREAEAWSRRTEEETGHEGKLFSAITKKEKLIQFQREWFENKDRFDDLRLELAKQLEGTKGTDE